MTTKQQRNEKKMKTTFRFSKTKVAEINRALISDDDATVWLDVCNGFARIRVDNVLRGENLLKVESQKVKMPLGGSCWFNAFELQAGKFDEFAERGRGLIASAIYQKGVGELQYWPTP